MLNKKLLGSVSSPPSDPDFENVTLLLNGDGTNGAQNNTFLDSSTNNFTITRNGNTTQGSFSPYGNLWSNYFNSVSDYLSFTSVSLGSSFTIEAFVFFPSAPSSQNIFISNLVGGGGTNWIGFNSTDLTFSYGGTNRTFSFSAVGGTWYYVQIINSSSSLSCYINGSQIGTTQTGPSSFSVDALCGYSSNGFVGYLSNVRVNNTALSVFSTPTTPLTAISGTQLLACQSNRFRDNSTNNYTLTVSGTPSVQRFSPFEPTAPYDTSVIGGSGYFDGSGDYLSAADNAALQMGSGDFTVEAWVYSTATNSGSSIVDKWTTGSAANSGYLVSMSDSSALRGGCAVGGTEYIIDAPAALPRNAWNHVAVVRSSNTFTLYQNGVSASSTTISGTLNNAQALGIGARASGSGSQPWTGYIANARVIKGTALYTGSTYTIPTAPLTAVTNTQLLANMVNAGIPDLAMMNNLETVGNAQVSTSVKKYGTGSLAFDGTGDYLKFLNNQPNLSFGTGNFTIEFWVYHNVLKDYSGFIGGISASNTIAIFSFADGSAGVTLLSTGNQLSSSAGAFTATTWQHVALVRNAGVVTLYIGGTSVGTYTSSATMSLGGSDGGAIGTAAGTGDLNGYIDDLRVTKGLARYTAAFTPPTKALETF